MIVVLLRDKSRKVIASPKSAGWIGPGDELFPCEELATEAKFIARWKQLQKQRYKDAQYISNKPKAKAKKLQKYTVKATGAVGLLGAFAKWVKLQPYGSVGYFELITGKIPKRITDDAELVRAGRTVFHLPDGSLIVANGAGKIVFLDSDGGTPKTVAPALQPFLAKLAKGRTGISDLDDEAATGRRALTAWLAAQ